MKDQISEDLLTKYLLGESSPDETLKIEEWASKNSANAKTLEDVKIILETSRRMAQASPLSETAAWERFKSKRETATNQEVKIVQMPVYSYWLRIAAAALLFVGGGWMAYHFYTDQSGVSDKWVTLKAEDQARVDTLPDGSIIHINKHSTLAYARDFSTKREIKLSGEAFFDVKHNDTAPFTVQVGDVRVQDIGTAFNIKSRHDNTEIIVKSGVVKVSKNKNFVQLNAQQMVNTKAGDKKLEVKRNADELYNYYVSGIFAANNTPLWRLVEVLNEAYDTKIKIANNALRNAPITVTIKLQNPVENALDAISLSTPNMHLQKSGSAYIIN